MVEEKERLQVAALSLLLALAEVDGELDAAELEHLHHALDLDALSPAGRAEAIELILHPPSPAALAPMLASLAAAPAETRAGVMLAAIDLVETDDEISPAEAELLGVVQRALAIDDAQRSALASYAAAVRMHRRRGVEDAGAAQARRRARQRLAAAGVQLPRAIDPKGGSWGGEKLAAFGAAALRRLGAAKGARREDALVAALVRSRDDLSRRAAQLGEGEREVRARIEGRVAALTRAIERRREAPRPTVALVRGDPAPAGLARFRWSEVRGEFRDADILMFHGQSALSRMIQAGGGCKYSHAGLVAWWGPRAMLLHAHPASIRAVPLGAAVHEYDGEIDWYRIRDEHRASADVAAMITEAQAHLGLPFAKLGLIRTVLNEVAGVELPDDCESPEALFCCQYVARAFRAGGLPLQPQPDAATFPSEIAASPVLRLLGTVQPDVGAADARRTLDR